MSLRNDRWKLNTQQIESIMSIVKQGAGFYVELKGGQGFVGNNFLYIARQIRERFKIEISAVQLKNLFDKNN